MLGITTLRLPYTETTSSSGELDTPIGKGRGKKL